MYMADAEKNECSTAPADVNLRLQGQVFIIFELIPILVRIHDTVYIS